MSPLCVADSGGPRPPSARAGTRPYYCRCVVALGRGCPVVPHRPLRRERATRADPLLALQQRLIPHCFAWQIRLCVGEPNVHPPLLQTHVGSPLSGRPPQGRVCVRAFSEVSVSLACRWARPWLGLGTEARGGHPGPPRRALWPEWSEAAKQRTGDTAKLGSYTELNF